jgi:hypothetical protein
MNAITAYRMLNNTNAADFGGRRLAGGATFNSVEQFNTFYAGQGLPTVVIYDAGYYPAPAMAGGVAGGFIKFIPDGKVIVIGKRPQNASIGEYQMTTNLNTPDKKPGSYAYVKDSFAGINAPKMIPGSIQVHRGHNGGPAIYYPSAVVIMNV